MMKSNIILLSIVLIAFSAFSQNKMQVSATEAGIVAEKAIKSVSQKYISTQPIVDEIIPWYYNNHVAMYEIMFQGGETVVIAGHKAARPILAIEQQTNSESILRNIEDLPEGYRYFIEKIYQELCYCFDTMLPENNNWIIFSQNDNVGQANRIVLDTLTKTHWMQSRGNTNCSCNDLGDFEEVYNKYMPFSNGDCGSCYDSDVRYPTGCTVTALGQIMNYWKYPLLLPIETQIDWCNMPDIVDCHTTPDKQKEAVAQLMLLLDKEFGTTYGSLRNDFDHCYGYLNPATTTTKLREFFGYSNDLNCIYRALYTGSWHDAIKDEILAKRPVLYWAFEDNPSYGSHTFVCDGYDENNDLFHFNWGHGSRFAWLPIDSIVEGYHQHWTRLESAMIKIKPRTNTDICDLQIPLGDFYDAYYSTHIFNYNSNSPLLPEPYSITPKTMTVLTSASSNSREEFRTIPSNATAIYQAHEEVVLKDRFTAKYGSDFTVRIEPCALCEERVADNLETNVMVWGGDVENESKDAYLAYKDEPSSTITDISPNPTDRMLTVATNGKAEAIVIYTADGRPVGGWRLLSLNDEKATLDVSSLADGVYILTVRLADGTVKATKFIKKE